MQLPSPITRLFLPGKKCTAAADKASLTENRLPPTLPVLLYHPAKQLLPLSQWWSEDSPDVTAEILDDPNYRLWIICYELDTCNKSAFTNIVALANECDKHGVKTVMLTSSDYSITDPFRHDVNAAFPFYYCDGTVLKTMIRSNPGIMLMKGATVMGMWHYHQTPSFERLNDKFFTK